MNQMNPQSQFQFKPISQAQEPQQIRCVSGHLGSNVCIRRQCDKKPFICQNKQCQCKRQHAFCIQLMITPLLDKVQQKIKSSIIQDVNKFFDRLVQQIIKIKNKMVKTLNEQYSTNLTNQRKVIQKIHNKQINSLSSNDFAQIYQKINQKVQINQSTSKYISDQINQIQQTINKYLNDYKQKFNSHNKSHHQFLFHSVHHQNHQNIHHNHTNIQHNQKNITDNQKNINDSRNNMTDSRKNINDSRKNMTDSHKFMNNQNKLELKQINNQFKVADHPIKIQMPDKQIVILPHTQSKQVQQSGFEPVFRQQRRQFKLNGTMNFRNHNKRDQMNKPTNEKNKSTQMNLRSFGFTVQQQQGDGYNFYNVESSHASNRSIGRNEFVMSNSLHNNSATVNNRQQNKNGVVINKQTDYKSEHVINNHPHFESILDRKRL